MASAAGGWNGQAACTATGASAGGGIGRGSPPARPATARYTPGCTAMPQWLERTSTCSAPSSRQARQSTMPSVRE